jgi:hypothetical protein
MGDFGTAVRYLDWVKSRQATLLEAESATVPFTKYYGLQRSRSLKKIPFVINIPAHTLNPETDFQYLPRLIFQYKITSPFDFNYFVKFSEINDNTINSGVIAIRYTDEGGETLRFAIKNNFIGLHRLCDLYQNQIILQEFFLEFWLGTKEFDNCGISEDLKITMSALTNPLFPEELERPITIEGPFDYPEFSWYIPFNLPQDNSLPIVGIPDIFITDESGNILTDESGNRITVRI